MCNPPQDGGSIDNAQVQEHDGLMHYTSGVYNKAFCLLSKTGWTTKKAFQVFARANRDYWTSGRHLQPRRVWGRKGRYGVGLQANVTAAFTAVGVKCA